jgi:phosphatidylglycerophosphate synthase
MLDAYIRPFLDPSLNKMGRLLAHKGMSANTITVIGFGAGVVAILLIAHHMYLMAAGFIVFNRICDGLDGAVARVSGMTDLGGFLDISCDFIIYSGVIFAFAIAEHENSLWAAFLIFSYIGPITTFLAYAVMAEKKKVTTEIRGKKSFYYLGGICEGSETASVMVLLCFKPHWFQEVCAIYGAMCWLTTIGRVSSAYSLSAYKVPEVGTEQPDQ